MSDFTPLQGLRAPPARNPALMNRMLSSLALGMFALGTDLFVMAGVLPHIARELGVDLGRAGWLVSAFALVYGLSAPLLAALTAHVSARKVAIAALGAFALASAVSAVAPDFAVLLACRVVAAFGASAFAPLASSLAATSVPPRSRGRALALVAGGTSMATVLGSPLGTWIAHTCNWRVTFVAVSSLALLGIAGLCVSEFPRQTAVASTSLRERLAPLTEAQVVVVLLPLVLWTMAGFNVYTYLPALLPDAHYVGAMLLLYGIASVTGVWLGGRLTDRFGARRSLLAGLVALAMVYACWPWLVRDNARAAIAMLPWGVAGWALLPAQQHRVVSLAPQRASVLLGLYSAALYLGIALGSLLGGMQVRATHHHALVLPLTSCALVAAAFLIVYFQNQASPDQPAPNRSPDENCLYTGNIIEPIQSQEFGLASRWLAA